MVFQGTAGGGCVKPASGSVVLEGRQLNKHWNESKLPRRSDFSLSYFYFLYLYERGISGRGSLWWSRVCVCVRARVYYKAIFSSEGRLALLERRARDCQLPVCFCNVSKFAGNCFTDYRYISRQQSMVNFVKDFISSKAVSLRLQIPEACVFLLLE